MIHKYNLYINQGERKIPSLVEQGDIDLPADDPSVDQYRRTFEPTSLWTYLYENSDLQMPGLYLSLYCVDRPTYQGKRWFVYIPYSVQTGMEQSVERAVGWVAVKGIQFWNASFREYARINQARSIMDYTLYISRCFGYAFMTGQTYGDEEDEARTDFTIFHPSIHHYHSQVALDESSLWQPFSDDLDWFPTSYTLPDEDGVEPVLAQAVRTMTDVGNAMRGVAGVVSQSWQDESNNVDLGELLSTDDDSEIDEED